LYQGITLPNGSLGSGADGHIYPQAHYSAIFNDANDTWGIASFTGGFGNDNYTENGVVFGNDNILGTTPNLYHSSLIMGTRIKASGTNTFAFGNFLDVNESYSFNVGFGKLQFKVNRQGVFLGDKMISADENYLYVGTKRIPLESASTARITTNTKTESTIIYNLQGQAIAQTIGDEKQALNDLKNGFYIIKKVYK
jgi:hypothetical protein